ncbi:hypothetical protein PIB30_104436, partial [Stylosanthes scabra]|nr:hypothetical protein [Stylosanthes scabra]
TTEEALDLIELVANNQYMYSTPSERGTMRKGINEVETLEALIAQNKTLTQQINLLNSKLGEMQVSAMNLQIDSCD